jgi:hypothetical protein
MNLFGDFILGLMKHCPRSKLAVVSDCYKEAPIVEVLIHSDRVVRPVRRIRRTVDRRMERKLRV